SPRIIAGSNVLHRLLVPRHPPCALINLTLGTTCKNLQKTEDARVHYAVLKIRTEPCLRAPHPGGPSAGRSSKRPPKAAASSGPNSVPGVPPPSAPPFRSSPRGERTSRAALRKETE